MEPLSNLGSLPANMTAGNTGSGGEYPNNVIGGSSKVHQGNSYSNRIHIGNHHGQEDKLRMEQIPLTDPRNDFSSLKRTKSAVDGTCEWVFGTKEFCDWKKSQNALLLSVTGAPGIGKTVISAFLVDKVAEQFQCDNANMKVRTVYFFCDNNSKDRTSEFAILRGLLFQLCLEESRFMHHMQKEYSVYNKHPKEKLLMDIDILWRAFCNILDDPIVGQVVVIIDALDECGPASSSVLMEYLRRVIQPAKRDFAIPPKFVVTCRRPATIGISISRPHQHLEVTGEKILNDLELYITAEVTKLFQTIPKSLNDLRTEVNNRLRTHHGKTFLWVFLVVSQLRRVQEPAEMLDLLERGYPDELFELYDKILEKIPPRSRQGAHFVFRMVTASSRPMTEYEILRAYSLSSSDSWIHEGPARLESHAIDNYSDLVYVEKHNEAETLQFVHPTVKDYLLENSWAASQKAALHLVLLSRLLLLSSAVWIVLPSSAWLPPASVIPNLKIPSGFKFCWLLACTLWNIVITSSKYLDRIHRRAASILPLRKWTRLYYHVDLTLAHFLIFRIMFKVLWLEHSSQSSRSHPYPKLLLSYASGGLHAHAVQARKHVMDHFPWASDLLEKNGYIQKLWLKLAAESQYKDSHSFVERLLGTGARIETKIKTPSGIPNMTPLATAAAHGNVATVEVLLRKGADIESRDGRGWTPLRWAASCKNLGIVEMLVNKRADVEAVDENGDTTLMWMMGKSNGSYERRDLNVAGDESKAIGSIHISNDDLVDASQWGAICGQPSARDLVKLLIRSSKDINSIDAEGMTALMRAAKNQQWLYVRLLLEARADVDIRDKEGMTALLWALRAPRTTIVYRNVKISGKSKVFLGQIVKRRYLRKNTRQHLEEEFERSMESLCRRTSKIDAQDFSGRTALSLAAENGQYQIVLHLLKRDVDPNAQDLDGLTPLMWASRIPSFCSVVFQKIQISGNAKVYLGNALVLEDPEEHVPRFEMGNLHKAERNDIIRVLLKNDADVDITDGKGRNALCFALQDELNDTVALLKKRCAIIPPGTHGEYIHGQQDGELQHYDIVCRGNAKCTIGGDASPESSQTLTMDGVKSFTPKYNFKRVLLGENATGVFPKSTSDPEPAEKTQSNIPRCDFERFTIGGEADFKCRIRGPKTWIPPDRLRYEYLSTLPNCIYKRIEAKGNSEVVCANVMVIWRKGDDGDFCIHSQMVGNAFKDISVSEDARFRCDLFTTGKIPELLSELLKSVRNPTDERDGEGSDTVE